MGGEERGSAASRRMLRRLLVARILAALGLLGSATVARLRVPDGPGIDPLFWLLAVTFALTALHAATVGWAARHRWMVGAQMAADACIVSAAVLVTGGYRSPLVPLYVLPVVAAASVQYRRGGLLVAALNALLYGLIIVLQYQGAAGWGLSAEGMPPVRDALFALVLNGVGFVGVAWLTGYLSERLQLADERLEKASSVIADLQAFNQCVIDSLTGGLATTDAGGRILTFNRAAEGITGWPADAARGRPVEEVLQLPWPLRDALPTLAASGRGRRLDLEYQTRDGRRLDLGLTAAPLMGAAGRVGSLFTFQDVTEHRRRERETQTEKRLAAIGEMAAGIAHEIRNPLAGMTGSIQVLRQDLPLSSEQSQLMDIVLRESERLNDIVTNFLTYARPGRCGAQPVDAGRIVREAAALLRHSAERRADHEVVASVAPEAAAALGDEPQLRQVLWNLATNGLKAMPDGGRLELRVEAAGDGRVSLVVRDTGVGMAAADLDHVFEPFRSTFQGGTGLGLAIVHRIVRDLDGDIEVDSAPGAGTTVRVTLPAAVAVAALSA